VPVFLWLWCAVVFAATPLGLAAQWPGEIRGRVAEAGSGRPVATADVYLLPAGTLRVTSSGGAFSFRGLDAGRHSLRVSALGYGSTVVAVEIRNGAVTDVTVTLTPTAIEIEGLDAIVRASASGGITIDAERIRWSGGSTAADILKTVPGVLIVSENVGGPQTPTIRGSASDAVLVLVDGVPLNDPITGQADLSTIPSSRIASITVLPGGQSTRFGARAEAGVIVISSGTVGGTEMSAAVGTLGEWRGEASTSWDMLGGRIDAQGTYRERDGSFAFVMPSEFGGGSGTVSNAGMRMWTGGLGWARARGSRRTQAGFSFEDVDRGLPGRSFAPSPTARQHLRQARVFASGTREILGEGVARLSGYAQRYRTDFSDPAPPFGAPFDDETKLGGAGADATLTRPFGFGALGVGFSARHMSVESTTLSADEPMKRTDLGAWLTASSPSGPVVATGAVRFDRGGLPAENFVSHDLGLRATAGPVSFRGGHRSSYSPPTLGDQFFREGVGIEPNPDLQAERVPSEWTAGLGLATRVGGVSVTLDAEAFVGDVEGMILWLPDFRFVWSPRNQDVNRRGIDLRAEVSTPGRSFSARAAWSVNRATYDRPASRDVQVAYRPRHLGGVGVSMTRPSVSINVETRYTGARYPVPNDVNQLPGFWTMDVSVERRWRFTRTAFDLQLEVERLFDQQDALIFAFPHPGRTIRMTARVGGNH